MDNILEKLRDDEIDTLVQFKTNGMTLSPEMKTEHLSDTALDYMSQLKQQKPNKETPSIQETVQTNINTQGYNDIGNVHPTPVPTNETNSNKVDIEKYDIVGNTLKEAGNLMLTPYRKFKEWWNNDETVNQNSQINNNDRYKVSQLANPQDNTFTGFIGDIIGIDSIKEAGKREYTKDDIDNYRKSVENAIGDKYDIQYDENTGVPKARLKGTNNPYEPVLNDIADASFEEIEQRVKANTTQLATEIGLDIAGGYQGVKWASKFTKNPALLVVAGGVGSTIGSSAGATIGSIAQSIQSGEEITTNRLIEKGKEEAIDAMAGNLIVIGVIGSVVTTAKGAKKLNPFHTTKGGKDSYLEKDLYEVEQTGFFSSTDKINKREEQLKNIATQKAQAEDVFLDFGGKMEESEVMELVGQTNTKEILGNHYNHSQERINAEIQNSIQLTKNFKTKFNLDDQQSADLYRLARGGVKRIRKYYSNLYKNSKQLIEDEIGYTLVKVSSDTQQRLDDLLSIAKHPTNVQNTLIEEPVKNKFNKDYQNLLNLVNSYFTDTQGFTIKKLFEVQKTFNSFTNKHSDKFTYEQLKELDTVKDAIYKDINKGIKANVEDEKLQKQLVDLWANANKEYKNYSKLIQREDVLKKLLDKDNKFDVAKFTENVFKEVNKVDHEDINLLARFGRELKKIQGEDALDEFYSAMINGLLKARTVDVKTGELSSGIMQTITHKNKSVEVMNFDAFHKAFNSIDEKQLNKIFGQSEHGKKILFHLKNFDKLAQREGILQQNLIGQEFKYAESAMQEHEIGKVAYSTAFGLKFGAWRWLSKNIIRSKAYEDFLLRAITKPRYEDIDQAIKKLDYDQRKLNPMQQVDINTLRAELKAMKEATKKAEDFIKENPAASKDEIEQVTISGLLEYKPFQVNIRDFDIERLQAKELAKQEGMPQDRIDRINNFDELGREIKDFKMEINEITMAHRKNPPAKNNEDVLLKENVNDLKPQEPSSSKINDNEPQNDLTTTNEPQNITKSDKFTVIDALKIPEVKVSKWIGGKTSGEKTFSKKEEYFKQTSKTTDYTVNISDVDFDKYYKTAMSMMPTFQGAKKEMGTVTPQILKGVMKQNEREQIDTIWDYFGGGGSWGIFFGKIDLFPNIKKINIVEYSPARKQKIEFVHNHHKEITDYYESRDFYRIIEKILLDEKKAGNAGSGTRVAKVLLDDYVMKQEFSEIEKAALYNVIDYVTASFGGKLDQGVDGIVRNITRTTKGIGKAIDDLKEKGIAIQYHQADSYALDHEAGSNVLALMDPPYLKTKGYAYVDMDSGEIKEGGIVGMDIYTKTWQMYKKLKEKGNSVIYTDEAYYKKNIFKDYVEEDKIVGEYGKNAFDMTKDIADDSDIFMEIPVDDRIETLGIIKSKQFKKEVMENGTNSPREKMDIDNGNGGENRIDTRRDSNSGNPEQPSQLGERTKEETSSTNQSPAGEQSTATDLNKLDNAKIDYEEKAKQLNDNRPSFEELKALENLDGSLEFSQNVFIPLRGKARGKEINSYGAELYYKALDKYKEELPREINKLKYPINDLNIARLDRLRSYFKTQKEMMGKKTGFGSITNPNQFKALMYDLEKHGKINRATPKQNEEYENIYFNLQELYDELAPQIDELYGESIEESVIPFAKFGDNLLAGTLAGVETDEDGNITGFDPEAFIVGMGGYTVAKAGAKYLNKQYGGKIKEKVATKIQNFIDDAEEEMAKATGGGKPPLITGTVDNQGFYSVLEKVVDEKVGGKIDTVSLTKMLEKNGVKEDELEWSGLKELIENNDKLTKEQIQETIKENRLVIDKVNKAGNTSAVEEDVKQDMFWSDLDEAVEFTEKEGDIIEEAIKNGKDFKEAIIESGLDKKIDDLSLLDMAESSYKDWFNVLHGNGKYGDYTLPMGDNYRELLFRTPKIDGEYTSDHWEESNILLFTRVDDRAIDDKKTLFIEELQSDWHQAGRKLGYGKEADINEVKSFFGFENEQWDNFTKEVQDGYIQEMKDHHAYKNNGVPNAPFKKNWAELGLKRMIQEAVANDYDKIAWTTGQQQAKRYSLEKELDTIVYNKQTGYIQGSKDGDEVVFKKVATDEEVEAMLGKELTKRLIDPKSSTRDEIYVLKGDELKFGGDGMKAFYDNIVPNIAKKLFKKYKVKPKMEELDDIEEMVWSVDITPQMKEDIKKYGQPLYMVGGTMVGLEALNEKQEEN